MAFARSSRFRTIPTAILLACIACSSSMTTSSEPASIALTGPGGDKVLDVTPGNQLGLKVTVKNAAGEVIDSDGLLFTSRDTAIVAVNQTGVISTIGPGSTFVVVALPAAKGTLQDSVNVFVVVPVSDSGPR